MAKKKMTILLTGGEGFIGHHLSKLLLEQNYKVVTYDIQSHTIPISKSKWPQYIEYRTKTLQDQNLIRVRGDACDRGRLKDVIEEYKPTKIVHLAALPIANVSNDYPEEAHRHTLNTTITLLDVIRETKLPLERLLYISSSMVYGNFLRNRKGEILAAKEDQVCNPIGIYGAMKLSSELLVKAYNYRFGIPYTIVRPSAVYGPTDANRRVTEIFLTNAIEGKPLKLDNGGLHQLDFTFVEDLVQGISLALDKEEALSQTFNITRGQGRTIKDLAEVIKKLIPSTQIEYQEADVYRPNRGTLSITKARKLLGYKPKYSIEKGFKAYYKFITDNGFDA